MRFFRKKNLDDFPTTELEGILGFKPKSLALYMTAFFPRQLASDNLKNNERLEYLGDAVLGLVVADFLFVKYPFKDESFLTDMRSKIVKRDSLNVIAQKMGIDKVLEHCFRLSNMRIEGYDHYGNALESLVGVIYVDKKYTFTQRWIEKNILSSQLLDWREVEEIDSNARNTLHSWATRHDQDLDIKVEKMEEGAAKRFMAIITIDGYEVCRSLGYSKKEAINVAVKEAIIKLGI